MRGLLCAISKQNQCDKQTNGEKLMNTKINLSFEEHIMTIKSQINKYTIQTNEWNNDD